MTRARDRHRRTGRGRQEHRQPAAGAALGFRYVDTGAMYRVVGVLAAERGIDLDRRGGAGGAVRRARRWSSTTATGGVHVLADGRDLSRAIRTRGGGAAGVEGLRRAGRARAPGGAAARHGRRRRRGHGRARHRHRGVSRRAGEVFLTPRRPSGRAGAARRAAGRAATAADLAQMARRDRRARRARPARARTRRCVPAADAVVVDTTALGIDAVVGALRDARRDDGPSP